MNMRRQDGTVSVAANMSSRRARVCKFARRSVVLNRAGCNHLVTFWSQVGG